MCQDRPVLRGAARLLRIRRRGADVDRGVLGVPIAVGDQQRGGQVRIGSDRGQVPVHDHCTLRVTGEHHLGLGAARREFGVLAAQCGRSDVDAAHVVEPVPYAGIGGHILGGIVDGFCGDGAALLRRAAAASAWYDW